MYELGIIPIAAVVLATSISGITDLWKYRVYNALTFPLMLTGISYHVITNGWSGLAGSLFGLLFGFIILIVPYLLGLMGAGDVKLMAGVGAWFGVLATMIVFASTSLVAGIVAVLLIMIRGEFNESWATIKMILQRFVMAPAHIGKDDLAGVMATGSDRRLRAIPFAAMIPIGLAVTFLCESSGVF